MIFVGGVHGVGKSHFCSLAKERFGISAYSSGILIASYSKSNYLPDKKVEDVARNQYILKLALQDIERMEKCYLLDGHFCLYNKSGEIEEIASSVYEELRPQAILILTALPSVLYERLSSRDGIKYSLDGLEDFQKHEIQYASKIASILGVPIGVFSDMEECLEFVESQLFVKY